MEIVRVQRTQARPTDTPQNFGGTVTMQRFRQAKNPAMADMVAVFFEAGARTRPHIHASDQILYVVEGHGIVATEAERRLIRAGDIVVIPAGEWHWHGATATSAMCHLSVRPAGPTEWNAPLRDWSTYMEGAR
ncbi:MAG TPA: cupin domain-containing protein [bacterium]|nr:cupin domain-containing protein [bacterium]